MCDRNTLVNEQTKTAASDIPQGYLLRASDRIRSKAAVFNTMKDYPGDAGGELNGFVLSKFGFETEEPHRLCICKECHAHLSKDTMPPAALANGFWIGDLPGRFSDITWVERVAASPVRVKGHVVAVESRKVGNVQGSAQRSIRGTSVFYSSNACSVAEELPLVESGLLSMITVILTGSKVPTIAQLQRLFGARKDVIADLIAYMQDKDDDLLLGFPLMRGMAVNKSHLDSYGNDGAVPPTLLEAIWNCGDAEGVRVRRSSTYTNDRKEDDISDGDSDGDDDAGTAFVIDGYSVMDTGENVATSDANRPEVFDRLGHALEVSAMQEAKAALQRGKPIPGTT